jgi:hypothetical protein
MATPKEINDQAAEVKLALLRAVTESVGDTQDEAAILKLSEAWAWLVSPNHAHGGGDRPKA